MKALLTKFFRFSASHAAGEKIYGHNYVLGVTVDALTPAAERSFETAVESALIQRLESRDLGLHVDFLKGIEITDAGLLHAFWKVLEEKIKPARLRSLSLERDSRTRPVIARSVSDEAI